MLYLNCYFTIPNAKDVACILLFRKSSYKPNLKRTSKYGFSPDLRGKNGEILSMQVILDSLFHQVQPLYGAGRKKSPGLSVAKLA